MMITNSIRERWGFLPNQAVSSESSDGVIEPGAQNNQATGPEVGRRFRVSAQEWLSTWRIVE